MSQAISTQQDRFRRALLGAAVGDAFGAPFEGARVVGAAHLDALEASSEILRFTDDTHMTIGLAESLIAQDGFDGSHLAETFIRHYESEPWRGYGPGPPHVFALIRRGISWQDAATTLALPQRVVARC